MSRKPKKLPKNIVKRDRDELFNMFSGWVVRCECGHLRRDGYLCGHCDSDDPGVWPIHDEHPGNGFGAP